MDPKELEQYLDNPAAARKVPSSVYTNHTRDEMFLDLQPSNGNVQSCGGMQIPSTHLQSTTGSGISSGVGLIDPTTIAHNQSSLVAATRVHNSNDYYVSGGYEARYKEFY